MTLKQMEFFAAVCEKRSITKAAQQHFVSQQAMSKNIQDMEKELGVSLLHRSHQGVELTVYGERVYKEVREILDKVRRIENTVDWMRREEKEILHCGMAFGAMSALGFDIMADFLNRHPQIDLHVQDLPDLYCEEKLLEGELDAACLPDPSEANGERIRSFHLWSEPMALCIPRNNALYSREDVCYQDLQGQPLLLNGSKFHSYRRFSKLCEGAGFTPHVAFSANEGQLLMEMCARGVGIALLPAHMAQQGMAGIRVVPCREEELQWKLHLLVRGDRELSRGVRYLLAFLKDRLYGINL